VPSEIEHVAHKAVGHDVWGINSSGEIYRFDRNAAGVAVDSGALSQLSAGADGAVWGINAANQIWRFNPQTQGWMRLGGWLSQIAVGFSQEVWGMGVP
jgi:virginiamycin B lyase